MAASIGPPRPTRSVFGKPGLDAFILLVTSGFSRHVILPYAGMCGGMESMAAEAVS